MTVTSSATAATPGGASIALQSATTGTTVEPQWVLSGPGSIISTSTDSNGMHRGTTAQYVPPDPEDFDSTGTATITASVAIDILSTVTINLTPVDIPGLHWSTARAANPPWNAVAAGNGQFVAVGERGSLSVSSDGVHWTSQVSGVTDKLWAVGWGDAGWIAIRDYGGVINSADGITWTTIASGDPARQHAKQVAFGNGTYVVATDGPAVTSHDGVAWTTSTTAIGRVAFGAGVFVGTSDDAIVTSADGIHWTSASADVYMGSRVAFGNGRFLVSPASGSSFLSSTDGTHWTTTSGFAQATDGLAFGNGTFFAAGGDSVRSSSDGNWWNLADLINANAPVTDLAGSGNTIVQVSAYGSIRTSVDYFEVWNTVVEGSVGTVRGVDYADGRYVAVGSTGWALTSTDGLTWTRAYTYPSTVPDTSYSANAIAHRGNRFVTAGTKSTPFLGSTAAFSTSIDGLNWWGIASQAGITAAAHAVIDDGQRFIAVGDGGNVYASDDGTSWTSLAVIAGNPTLESVVHANGVYVAVSAEGSIAHSADAIHWVSAPAFTTRPPFAPSVIGLFGVTWDGVRFVVVGDDGATLQSTDGATWSSLGTYYGYQFYGVAASNGELVTVGNSSLATSRDGQLWHFRVQDQGVLDAVAYVNNRFVAVGQDGVVLISDH